MNLLFLALLLQSSLYLPQRTALENPAVVSQVPQKLRKDYEKLWARFVSAREDTKLLKDLDKFLKKQKTFDPAWTIQGYLYLYKGDDAAARERFAQALQSNSNNRIAMYYLAELAYAHGEYARAAALYAQLQPIDPGHPEIETKRQKAFLLATDNLLRAAARAENENRLAEAEELYRRALQLAPNEPALEARLADLLVKQDRNEEAEALRAATSTVAPGRTAAVSPPVDARSDVEDLEDLGRWGRDIAVFHEIRNAEAVTREQFATLVVRYFPQLSEFRKTPRIVTDIQDSRAQLEILTVVGVGLIDPFPNHAFEPLSPISRGDLATALARLSRTLGVSGNQPSSVSPPDVTPTNAMHAEIQLVLGFDMMALEDSGSFNVSGGVTGGQAVRSVERLLRIFQQAKN